jgi:hypothetical protein
VLHWMKRFEPLILYFMVRELTWLSSKFRLHPEREIACDQAGPGICGVCDCGVHFVDVLYKKGLLQGNIFRSEVRLEVDG